MLSRVASVLMLFGMFFLPYIMPTSAGIRVYNGEERCALNEPVRLRFVFCRTDCHQQHVKVSAPNKSNNDFFAEERYSLSGYTFQDDPSPQVQADQHNYDKDCIICAVIISTTRMEDEGNFTICKLTTGRCSVNHPDHTITLVIERPTEKPQTSTRNPISAAPPEIKENTSDILTTEEIRNKSTKPWEIVLSDSPGIDTQKDTSKPGITTGVIVVIVAIVIIVVVISMLRYKKCGANRPQTDYELAANY